MKVRFILIFVLGLIFSFKAAHVEATFTLKKGRIVNVELMARYPVQEHFTMGCSAIEASDWSEALKQFRIVVTNFPASVYAQESHYYEGICHYNLQEFDFANDSFTTYLKVQSNPRFFQEAIEFKYQIAEQLSEGAKRRFFGTKQFPKWACGKALALTIYDEVVAAVPSHDIAARALVSKGCLLWKLRDYRPCVEAFQLVIRRFPKHELTPECYLYISRVFIEQCRIEFQNPDILAFAQINLRKFKQEFPREERICEAEDNVQVIKEIYAKGLYDTGCFYVRTYKSCAAIIYFKSVIYQFPDTCIADLCRDQLQRMGVSFEDVTCDSSTND